MDAIDSEYPMRVEYGDFGEAAEDVQKESGNINYNVKLTISFMDDKEEEEEKKEGEGGKQNDAEEEVPGELTNFKLYYFYSVRKNWNLSTTAWFMQRVGSAV